MQTVAAISSAITPLFLAGIVLFGLIKKTDIYSSFICGAKKGIGLSFRVLPYITAMIFAVRMIEASGAFEMICKAIAPVVSKIGIPPEIIPIAILRPFSGGASLGLLAGVFSSYGADSYLGRVASTYMGSSETLFYTVSLYFVSVGIKKTRYVIPVALITDFLGLILSCIICRYF